MLKMIDFCINYFGKSLTDLEYTDIEKYFISDVRTESNKIEYKSFSKNGKLIDKFSPIIQSICSFLNSDGGILVWGAPKGEKIQGRKEKDFNGELCPVNQLIEKDYFINKISDNITPLPTGINLKTLTKDEDNFIYIIEVQKSPSSPHQYKDRYYVRIDGQNRPASHYYIEALFKKISYPNLVCKLAVPRVKYNNYNKQYETHLWIEISNQSQFQNESELFIRMSFASHSFKDLPVSKKTLFYGIPIVRTEAINFKELSESHTIQIVFGGKKSPLKVCKYKVSYRKKSSITNVSNSITTEEIIEPILETLIDNEYYKQ